MRQLKKSGDVTTVTRERKQLRAISSPVALAGELISRPDWAERYQQVSFENQKLHHVYGHPVAGGVWNDAGTELISEHPFYVRVKLDNSLYCEWCRPRVIEQRARLMAKNLIGIGSGCQYAWLTLYEQADRDALRKSLNRAKVYAYVVPIEFGEWMAVLSQSPITKESEQLVVGDSGLEDWLRAVLLPNWYRVDRRTTEIGKQYKRAPQARVEAFEDGDDWEERRARWEEMEAEDEERWQIMRSQWEDEDTNDDEDAESQLPLDSDPQLPLDDGAKPEVEPIKQRREWWRIKRVVVGQEAWCADTYGDLPPVLGLDEGAEPVVHWWLDMAQKAKLNLVPEPETCSLVADVGWDSPAAMRWRDRVFTPRW